MGRVAVALQIIPKAGADINVLQKMISKQENVKEVKLEAIAFGLHIIKVLALIPDAAGGTEMLEKEMQKIKGVERVEVLDVSLV